MDAQSRKLESRKPLFERITFMQGALITILIAAVLAILLPCRGC